MLKIILVLFSIVFTSYSVNAKVLKSELPSEKIQNFLDEVESKLPPSMISEVIRASKNKPVLIKFQNLGKLELPRCNVVVDSFTLADQLETELLNAQKKLKSGDLRYNFGVYSNVNAKKSEIYLNIDLIKYIEGDNQTYECEHKNSKTLIQGVVINSLARLIDSSVSTQSSKDKKSTYRFSDVMQYRYKAGWDRDGNSSKDRRQAFWPRAINPYEYAGTIHDHFALNVEFFLLDPEFACRRPLIHEYLVGLFKVDPFEGKRNCSVNMELKIPYQFTAYDEAGNPLDDFELATYNLSPDRVYNVNYFLAGIGGGAGAFGHSMFRIVTCDDPSEPVTANCQKRQSNLIINPRANPLEMRLDNMKGAFGGYPSMFLVNPTHEIIEEYSVSELRNSYNIPMTGYKTTDELGNDVNVMNPDDKRRFLYAVVDQYWNYYGNYKFLSNNCADEALRLYQMSTNNDEVLSYDPKIAKPFKIASLLDEEGLADPTDLNKQEKDKNLLSAVLGMLFKSGDKMKWEDFEEKCDLYSDMEFSRRSTHKSWKCHFYKSLRQIMILEGAQAKEVDNTKDIIKKFKSWIKLTTPSKKISKEQAEKLNESEQSIEQSYAVVQVVEQIRKSWQTNFSKASTKEDKVKIAGYYYTVIYHLYWKRAEQIGNQAVQLAYEIVYHRGKRGDKNALELPKNLKVSQQEYDLIKEAIDKYAELERSLMPYRELSIQEGSGYGIPLKNEVVRDERFTELLNNEYQYLLNVVNSVSRLLGMEHETLRQLGNLHAEIADARLELGK